jgi:hypothetical protein
MKWSRKQTQKHCAHIFYEPWDGPKQFDIAWEREHKMKANWFYAIIAAAIAAAAALLFEPNSKQWFNDTTSWQLTTNFVLVTLLGVPLLLRIATSAISGPNVTPLARGLWNDERSNAGSLQISILPCWQVVTRSKNPTLITELFGRYGRPWEVLPARTFRRDDG